MQKRLAAEIQVDYCVKEEGPCVLSCWGPYLPFVSASATQMALASWLGAAHYKWGLRLQAIVRISDDLRRMFRA